MAMIQVPTEKRKASKTWCQQKFLMIGQAGTGKSEFWAQGDKTLFIDTEGNLNHLDCFKMPGDKPVRTMDDLRDIVSSLIQAKQSGKLSFDTVVLDTVDKFLSPIINEEIISRAQTKYKGAIDKGLQVNTIGDVPDGNGWAWQKELANNVFDKLVGLDTAVVLIAHIIEKKIETPTKKYDKMTINVGGQLGVGILGWAHHILHIEGLPVGGKIERYVYSLPTMEREAKSHGGIIPSPTKWSLDPKENYLKLRQLFT